VLNQSASGFPWGRGCFWYIFEIVGIPPDAAESLKGYIKYLPDVMILEKESWEGLFYLVAQYDGDDGNIILDDNEHR